MRPTTVSMTLTTPPGQFTLSMQRTVLVFSAVVDDFALFALLNPCPLIRTRNTYDTDSGLQV